MPLITKLFLSPFIFFLFISTGYAKSNDPFGDIFIPKNFGDLSNCGPIAALMVSKYTKKKLPTSTLSLNIQKARQSVQNNKESNRWWRLSDIKKYFHHQDIDHTSLTVTDSESIKQQIDKNGVVIINVNMNNLSMGRKVGKPYFTFPIPGGWGHFLLIVGYKEIGNKLVFDVHDSFLKRGNNRSYYADEILSALKRYNPELLVVYNKQNEIKKMNLDDIFEMGIVDDLENEIKIAKLKDRKSHLSLIGNAFNSEKLINDALAHGLKSGKYQTVINNLNLELATFDSTLPQMRLNNDNIRIASVEKMQE